MERLKTSYISINNGNIKYPIGKSIFSVNLQLKLFPAPVANADIGSLNSFHTFLEKCLNYMLVKFVQNRMVQTTQYFDLFDQKQINKQTNKSKKQKTKQNKTTTTTTTTTKQNKTKTKQKQNKNKQTNKQTKKKNNNTHPTPPQRF